eukprot:CAMPEP_0172572346 /NCGR_PEP_ID=MMETSP1067-20121228/134772_1 /TAXON_ID=265564 ORGANISM="Thalassiosira punctigera, Strain Tpunct2005C2" /NCGR_SAMPLE_ID=MMETSP1067 /ASSEMBLY_ACC=CAM_ASM_000444 /LENGTH=254 /DNA_ID=CAMNT_0013364867 /DNA_START=105 /DNA_END=866 /DNA_ORIENTATION=+
MPSAPQEITKPTVLGSEKTHYDVLGISPAATSEQVKVAYRSLIVRCHPDKLPSDLNNNEDKSDAHEDKQISEGLAAIDMDDDDEEVYDENDENNKLEADQSTSIAHDSPHLFVSNKEEREISSQKTTSFHQIQAAYHCLHDPHKRRQYDASISRKEEREEWKLRGALQVNLSEMESDLCCVLDEEDPDEENGIDQETRCDEATGTGALPVQKVFFYPCRCGDTFQIVEEELLESICDAKTLYVDKMDTLTACVW